MATIAPAMYSANPIVGLPEVLRSEFHKLRTVRSTLWILVAIVASNVIVAALAAIFLPSHLTASDKATIDSIRVSLAGLHLSQIAFGVLGVLTITSEYTTGMIRATLSAVPRRRQVLTAKVLVLLATGLIIGTVSCLGAYFSFQGFLSGDALKSSIGDSGVLRAVIGGGLYLTVLAMLGFGLGAVLRSSAGAIATLFGLLFVPTILVSILPQTWRNDVGPYLPMNSGEAIYTLHRDPGSLAPLPGFTIFCLYTATALLTAFVLITRRDA